MTSVRELAILLTGKDQASAVLQRVGQNANGMAQQVGQGAKGASSALGGIAQTAAGMAAGLGIFSLISTGVSAAGGAIIGFNGKLEQAQIAFTTMLGSGEQASAFLKNLQGFAAKTPFEFPELLGASQKLLAMGFSADSIIPTMTAVGDAVAGLGGSGVEVDRVTTALGQMRAKGKVSAEEMMQMTEAGIPVWDMLAQKIGVSVPEAMKLAEQGVISSDKAIAAITQGMTDRFGGMMAKQSLTFDGAMSTIRDVLTQTTATAFEPFFKLISAGALTMATWLQTDAFAAFGQNVAQGIQAAIDALTPFAQVVQGIIETMFNLENTDALQIGLEKIFGQDSEVVGMVMEFVAGVQEGFATITQIISDAIGTVQQVFAGEWLPSDEIQPFVNLIGEIATVVRDVVLPAFFDLVDTAIPVWSGMAAAVDQILNGDIIGGIQTFVSAVGTYGSKLVPMLAGWASAFVDWAVPMIPDLLRLLGGLVADVIGLVAAAVPDIMGTLAEWGAAFVEWVGPRIGPLMGALGALLVDLIGWAVGTALPAILGTMVQWGLALVSWVGLHALPALPGALAMVLAGVLGWIRGAAGSITGAASAMGQGILQGIVQGIQNGAGQVNSAITGMANQAINTAKATLGIASPSKEFERIGQQTIEGLVAGIQKSKLADDIKTTLQDFIRSTREYLATNQDVKAVEQDIARIRDQSQTASLFRSRELIGITTEELRLKQGLALAERDLLPARQALDSLSRSIAQTERGSLADRTKFIETDTERNKLRLQALDIEERLESVRKGSKQEERLKKELDALRDKDQALQRETERTRLLHQIASSGEKVRQESLKDTIEKSDDKRRAIEKVLQILQAEESVYKTNDTVVKNAVANEVAYRERLIAVLEDANEPLQTRVRDGLKLVEQLKSEGKISDELAGALEKVTGGLKAVDELEGITVKVDSNEVDEATKRVRELIEQVQRLSGKLIRPGDDGEIEGYATGGTVPGPLGSPRLAVVHGGETIIPVGGRGGAGTTVVVNVNAPVYGYTDFEDAVVSAMSRAGRRGRV